MFNKSEDIIEVIRGDITKVNSDAIVNAANSSLMGGGGVDGAIHRAGGPAILEACREIVAKHGSLPAGEAVITTAGMLQAKYVIHTVGPVWKGGDHREMETLEKCYNNSLSLALEHACKTIAFPNISTGVYGFPKKEAALISVTAVRRFLMDHSHFEQVLFVCFDDENYHLIHSHLDK